MKLFPERMIQTNTSRQYVVNFKGINKNDNFRWGELADCENLSHDAEPFLYPRGERNVETVKLKETETVTDAEGNETLKETITEMKFSNPTTLFMHDGIAVVDGTGFYYKGAENEAFEKKFNVTEGKKQIAQLGNYTVVFPDKIWYNIETGSWGDATGNIIVPTYVVNGETYAEWYATHNQIIISDQKGKHTAGADFAKLYKAGDVIFSVSGTAEWYGDKYSLSRENIVIKKISSETKNGITTTTATFEDNTFWDSTENGRKIEGLTTLKLTKSVPDFDYICCADGRLWGCEGNRIFASAYQDPTVFNRYNGLADDSYYIDVTTPGGFTGCAAYSNHVVFFKENTIHRIYGTRPANFQMTEVNVPGVQKGCHDSLKVINERLYYKGERGIYAYMGSMPALVCEAFGLERFSDAVAGAKDHKYYISMKDEKENYQLFVFDTEKGTLLREDNTQFLSAAQLAGDLYFFDDSKKLMKITDTSVRSDIEWSAELREFNETVNQKKGFSRLSLRYEMGEGCFFKVEVAADNEPFKAVATITKPGYRVVGIPLPKNRCDKFKVRISGKGECKIHNLVRDFYTGRGER